jgi:hypothetical protein
MHRLRHAKNNPPQPAYTLSTTQRLQQQRGGRTMTNISFVELDSKQFNPATTYAQRVRLRLAQADIASGHLGHVVDQLMQLSDTKEGVLNWRNKLIISADKPVAERRSASEIPAMVHYFRALTAQWPFWLHLAEKDGDTVGSVLRLLVGTERIRQNDGREDLLLTDADKVRAQAKRLFEQMKHLYRCHGLHEDEDTEMAKAITRAVNAMFLKT